MKTQSLSNNNSIIHSRFFCQTEHLKNNLVYVCKRERLRLAKKTRNYILQKNLQFQKFFLIYTEA